MVMVDRRAWLVVVGVGRWLWPLVVGTVVGCGRSSWPLSRGRLSLVVAVCCLSWPFVIRRGRWSFIMAVESWPLVVGCGRWSLVVAVGRWSWPLAVGRGRWPLVIVGHRCACNRHAPVVSAAPSKAEPPRAPPASSLLVGAEKAPTARPEAWHMVAQGMVAHFEVARRRDTKGGWVSARTGHSWQLHAMAAVQMDRAGHCGQAIVGRSSNGQPHKRRNSQIGNPRGRGESDHQTKSERASDLDENLS